MRHLVVDLALQFPMPPFESGDMAFSRHNNSFQASKRINGHKKITACRPLPSPLGKAGVNRLADGLTIRGERPGIRGMRGAAMLPLTKEQEAALGLELAAKRQEHADLDAAIHTLAASAMADQMLIQRLKKRKLGLKDRIVQLENLLIPDIIA